MKVGDVVLVRRNDEVEVYLMIQVTRLNRLTGLVLSPIEFPHLTGQEEMFSGYLGQWYPKDEWILPFYVHKCAGVIPVPPLHSPSLRQDYAPGDKIIFLWKQGSVVGFVNGKIWDSKNGELLLNIQVQSRPGQISVPRNCVHMFNWQSLHAACRAAVYAWMHAKSSLNMHRDVARLIGMLVWETRDDREWEKEEEKEERKKKKFKQ
jgi:hypothetical protein